MTEKKAVKARKQAYATAKKASIKAALTDRYLTVREAAEWLKMSESHIYFLKYKRKIPYVKLGGKLLFEKDALRRWIDGNSSVPTLFEKKPRKPRKKQYYDIGTNQLVDAPAKEVTYEGAKRFLDALNQETAPKPDKAREVKKIVIKAKEIRKPGEKWQDCVKRATLQLKQESSEKEGSYRSKPMTNQEVVEMLETASIPNLNTVLELGHLQIQILRTGKEISIIPDMEGDPIDISAGICSLMMKNPAYRRIFETGVYMYQRFQKP